MKAIWKYPLKIADEQSVRMPMHAEILSCQFQGGQLCLWAMVDPSEDARDKTIRIFGTGHPISDPIVVRRRFIATAQRGPFVWHVFEE